MAGKDIIMATQQELKALHVIRKTIDKVITQKEAAQHLNLSERQIRRKVKVFQERGDLGLVHRLRGRPSNRKLPCRDKVLKLFKDNYPDFGPTLASEKLFERDKIKVNNETLRIWLIKEDIPYRKRRKRPHRHWRQRKLKYGQMTQLDGSHHPWLEDRGPSLVFMGYIDDATGRPFGRFYEYEGTIPALDSFRRYIRKYGIPLSVYLDKHTTYKSTGKPSLEDELNNAVPLSQFERALKELGVRVIHANSPQAKGRIERLFKTFQDRLIKELRLEGACTLEEANAVLERYLPKYAGRFSVKAAKSGDMHRPIPNGIDINRVLCIKNKRALRNDFTVAHNKKLYQVLDNIRTKSVMVEEYTNGSMALFHKEARLRCRQITTRPQRIRAQKKQYRSRISKVYVPPADHPWRKFRLGTQKGKVLLNEKELLPVK